MLPPTYEKLSSQDDSLPQHTAVAMPENEAASSGIPANLCTYTYQSPFGGPGESVVGRRGHSLDVSRHLPLELHVNVSAHAAFCVGYHRDLEPLVPSTR